MAPRKPLERMPTQILTTALTFIFDNDSDAASEAEVRYMQMVRTDSYRSLRVAVEGRASQLLRL